MPDQIFEKVCCDCGGDPQPLTNFHINRAKRDGHMGICKSCARARAKEWRDANPEKALAKTVKWQAENPERVAATKRRWKERNPDYEKNDESRKRKRDARHAKRLEAIAALGGKCNCCGLEDVSFICFEHVGGWGAEHRKTVQQTNLPSWLKKHHYPSGNEICPECGEQHGAIILLCYNCNMSVAASPDGTCAHKESFEETKRKRFDSGSQDAKARYAREDRWNLRESGIVALGGECFCCKEQDHRLLCFEHVDNWGRTQRAEMPHAMFLRWLRDHGYPKGNETCLTCGEVHQGIRVACFSCNLAAGKSEDGICPHQQSIRIAA